MLRPQQKRNQCTIQRMILVSDLKQYYNRGARSSNQNNCGESRFHFYLHVDSLSISLLKYLFRFRLLLGSYEPKHACHLLCRLSSFVFLLSYHQLFPWTVLVRYTAVYYVQDGYDTGTIRVQYGYDTGMIRVRYGYDAGTVRVRYGYGTGTAGCGYGAGTAQFITR